MENQEFKYRGWLRVFLLFIPIFFITGIFQLIGGFFLGVDFTSLEKRSSLEDLIINFSGLVGTFFALWVFMKFVDKEPFVKLGFQTKNRLKEFVIGIVIGLIIMSLGYVTLIGLKEITFLKTNFNLTELIILVLIFIVVAVGEEVILRGYILKNLLFSFNKYVALIVSSILFSLIHGFNDHVDLFALFNLFLAGILLGLPYIYTKNLWFSIALHLSWNLFQALFGFNVSGHENYSLIVFEVTNQPNLLNGGAFGFEGSYLAIIAQVITITVIWFHFNRKKVINE
ncbi:CPBP family intramembrane glutamic endopeptidase [Polaribacter sargassicola]|uniref:CPBP family intramembrane glutamic endopeptidase n=1 Tax=Polaribacter sargassicola TaxID=2836891 RepID=UPI001F199F2F|nr:type II CAAX endopeptidase family protein [Polaribacter sp. DS7-9]MCG1037339.1 CPBP family intramembrane metalloprotease [Polaribacter sp. DS7-9]